MERLTITPRQNWGKALESLGYDFYKVEGVPMWQEAAYYKFTAAQIDELEAAANDVHKLCLLAVERIIKERLYPLLGIEPVVADLIEESWTRKDPAIYGRFDFMYDGKNPPKLLEYNADTPTTLFESSIVQWSWREQRFPDADQFNSIHEHLVARWRSLLVGKYAPGALLHVTCATPLPEDETTVQYIGQTAVEGGHKVRFIPIQAIGWDYAYNRFLDLDGIEMRSIFKLYPWEWIFKEEFGANVHRAKAIWLEPVWKMLLSNKGILPILWDLFPGHPNLLAAYRHEDALGKVAVVRKAILGREGSNIRITRDGDTMAETGGQYAGSGYIYQEYVEPPDFGGNRPNVGIWMVGGEACGMGIRESDTLIVSNESRFVPHIFMP
jgi:glutathionylspermidine synthase